MSANLMDKIIVQLTQRDDDEGECDGNDYNGRMGLRIASVFVILVTSSFGAFFPILASKFSFIRLPGWVFFITKFFGSGVIVATAFIHLLQPANEALSDDCLNSAWGDYPYAFAIMLVSLFTLFFFELLTYHIVEKKIAEVRGEKADAHGHSHFGSEAAYVKRNESEEESHEDSPASIEKDKEGEIGVNTYEDQDNYYAQLVAVFVLEFGVIFHSVFVGLSLAVAGEEFVTLFIVLIFHQMFEGLGLGSRIAETQWPRGKRATPWLLAAAYGLVTPISIAIGLGVRTTYPANSPRNLITNGIFDSISAGILIYTGLIELMAHEFLFSNAFTGPKGFQKKLCALFIMCVGVALMSLLGKWI